MPSWVVEGYREYTKRLPRECSLQLVEIPPAKRHKSLSAEQARQQEGQAILAALPKDCSVVAPSLIPRRPGDRVKTNRRDAAQLARLHRAGELTPVWVPDDAHEAMRDLVRARASARRVLGKARQHLQGFLLRHGRIYSGVRGWTKAYRRWLTTVRFDHPAQQIVLQDYIHAIEDAEAAPAAGGE